MWFIFWLASITSMTRVQAYFRCCMDHIQDVVLLLAGIQNLEGINLT
jgi:hypothetical protein